jgi:hypothetical protein
MIRRRRPTREIEFSFDSFLDVVANVCGIIIRLILVTWAGSRAYHTANAERGLSEPVAITASARPATPALREIADPLDDDLRRHRAELAEEQERLLQKLKQFEWLRASNENAEKEILGLAAAGHEAVAVQTNLAKAAAAKTSEVQAAQLSLADLQRRSKKVADELAELEKQPPPTKVLHYRTPLSHPVHTDELHFECQRGRISYLDVDGFVVEIKRGLDDKAAQLKNQWRVESTTGAIGAFCLHYVVERMPGTLDGVGGMPNPEGLFRYGVTGWVAEPIAADRGETLKAALAPGSEFRRQIEAVDPEHAVVTLWVYPDSFGLYRALRDYMHERGIEVAGRPLPIGASIASSRDGTASRGQ